MSRIKYHFALNEKGQIIDIADVTEKDRQNQYFCLNCGDKMIPRLGKRNAHHFAHVCTTPNCNPETYLHKLAKLKIKEKFESVDAFEISFRQVSQCVDKEHCPFYIEKECKSYDYRTYDLHKNYDTCLEEQVIGNYRADLLLKSSTKPSTPPILIEVLISHKCEEEKINSGYRIIEIEIKNEGDITRLFPITESKINPYNNRYNRRCFFYNFKETATENSKLKIRRIPKFYFFKRGSVYLSNVEDYSSCREVIYKDNPNAILELAIDSQVSAYELGLVKAAEMGYSVRNCLLCKYRRDTLLESNFCCLYKKCGTPKYPKCGEAINCQYFRKNQECIEELQAALISSTIIVCVDK